MAYSLVNTGVCVVFCSQWMTRFHLCQSATKIEDLKVSDAQNETPIGIRQRLLAF
jgi:hypothetical protein